MEDLGGEGGQTAGCGDSMEGQVDDLITLAGQREGETAGFGLEHPGQKWGQTAGRRDSIEGQVDDLMTQA